MSYQETLIAEINARLDDLAERREEWNAPWIAHAICEAHASGLAGNADSIFWQHCGYQASRKLVTEVINRRAGGTDDKSQFKLDLPGFARHHIQDYYVVKRGGKDVGICVLDLTDAEIDSKVSLYRAIGAANEAHADELARFKRWRSQQSAA